MSNVCPNCGNELQQGALVCRNCRKRVVNTGDKAAKQKDNKSRPKAVEASGQVKDISVKENKKKDVSREPLRRDKAVQTEKKQEDSNVQGMKKPEKNVIVNNNDNLVPNVSVGAWVLTLIITGIPLIGLIYMIACAFGKNKVKANYFKATLIIWILAIIFGGLAVFLLKDLIILLI